MGSKIPVTGISVRRPVPEQEGLIGGLATKTREFLGLPSELADGELKIFDDYVGPGYSLPTREMAEAVRTFARVEGILLDPVYTGRAFYGMLDCMTEKKIKPNSNVLFWHTGGLPAVFDYAEGLK